MKYVLLVCDDESVSPTNEEIAADPAHQRRAADVARRGAGLIGPKVVCWSHSRTRIAPDGTVR